MTWLELSALVKETTNRFEYGDTGPYLLIVTNPDGEGGGYDIYSSGRADETLLCANVINNARKTVKPRLGVPVDFEASVAVKQGL